jgi:endonuclease/exonuclease/phosphatase family metal-dependent hydrolase
MKNTGTFIKALSLFILLIHTPLLSFSQCNEQYKGGSIKIMTWNIYMLPHLLIHAGQNQRASEIVDVLKEQDVDIIVFEEAFDKKARNIIRKGLKEVFPYESGDPRKNMWWKTSCGVWILSKVPISVVKQIYFKHAMGSDRFACKGAILMQGEKNGFCFQLVGTHLQADLNSGKNVQPIRNGQYKQIHDELLEPYAEQNVPQFVAGDFNTIQADTNHHSRMVNALNLTECSLEGEKCFSFDYGNNDVIRGPMGEPQLIDYLFYSQPFSSTTITGTMHIVTFRKKWDVRHHDLSDHFAVAGEFKF